MYPPEIHEAHDYPLDPERLEIQVRMFSYGQRAISRHYAPTRAAKKFMLVSNLLHRKNYVTHYRNVKFYLDHEMRPTMFQSVINFAQAGWMETHISLNTYMRAAARNYMEKNFHKLRNNAVYG